MPSIFNVAPSLVGTEYTNIPTVTPIYKTINSVSKQLLAGEGGRLGYPELLGIRNVGGAFLLKEQSTYRDVVNAGTMWRGGANGQYYVGSIVFQEFNGADPYWVDYTPDAWAASAYSRMKPTQPNFQALNALYELKDLPGMLKQRLSHNGLKDVSNYWLALQFGWKPLLADIRNAVRTQINGQKRLQQLMRDNGKPVRRSIQMVNTSDVLSESQGNNYSAIQPILVTQYYGGSPHYRTKKVVNDRVWASAQFRYYLPPGPRDVKWRREMLRRIFGIQYPSPSVIYNAIPWSWLIDWFTNLGDVLENMDSGVADRLGATYFYTMRERSTVREMFSNVDVFRKSGERVTLSGSARSIMSMKARVAGDPFGFNTNQNTLTGMQLSILGSLGMSRVR